MRRERERARAREQERERERDPDDCAMELRSAAMHFFFSHTLQIISPTVHSVKTLQKLADANAFSHKSRDCGRAAVHSVPRLRSSSRRQMTTNPANSTTGLATNALSLRSCLCLARYRCLGLCGALCVVRFFRDCGPFAPLAISGLASMCLIRHIDAKPEIAITNPLPLVTVRSPPHHHECAWPFLWLFFGKTPASA